MKAAVFAIDPGTTESGWTLFDGERVIECGTSRNSDLVDRLRTMQADVTLAIEMVASYGMAVGREVFETCVWIGRFVQAWHSPAAVMLVYRRDVKILLCGSMKAKDPNIRQALIDRLGPQGTKKQPGPTYGVSGHVWSALAVAVTAHSNLTWSV